MARTHDEVVKDFFTAGPGVHRSINDPFTTAHSMAEVARADRVKADKVNHPAHYTRSIIEPALAIRAWGLGFWLGNVVKYIARAGHKDPATLLEDLKKAQWYLTEEIAFLERPDPRLGVTACPQDPMGSLIPDKSYEPIRRNQDTATDG